MSEPAAAPPPATGGQIARGAAWMMAFKLVDKAIGVVSTLILARLLVPADFGLVAMAMAVVAFTELMKAFGFDTALIQRQDAARAHYDTAWTFNVIFGATIAATLAALSLPMAHFYGDPRLTAVLLALGFSSLLVGFENIGVVAFRKDLDFRSEFRFLLIRRVAGFVVTVGTALLLRSYWAMVVGIVVTRGISVWMSYRLHPYRPRLDLSARRDLFRFSRWLFLSSLIGFVATRSTDFILGRTVGAHGLGIYAISLEVASMPSTELIAPLNRAAYPAYSRLSRDPPELQRRFIEVFGIIAMVSIPACGLLFALADVAVRGVLGVKWLEAVPMIRLFGLCGLLSALQSNLYLMNMVVGRPQANTLVSAVVLAITLPLIVWASLNHGVIGAGYAMVAQSALIFAGIVFSFRRNTGVYVHSLAAVSWRPLAATAVAGFAVHLMDTQVGVSDGPWLNLLKLVTFGIAGIAIYALVVIGVWRLSGMPLGAERTALEILRKLLRQKGIRER